MSLNIPQLSIITTPIEELEEDGIFDKVHLHPFTPSPQAVDEFDSNAVTSANRSAVVSKLLSDHLVSPRDDVMVNDDEIIVTSKRVNLPELDESAPNINYGDGDGGNDYDTNNYTRASSSYCNNNPPPSQIITTPRHTPPMTIQHKMLYQSVQAFASPIYAEDYLPQLHVGPEREVYFHTDSLGIKISRHTDGYVRVLSVTPYRAMMGSSEKIREGQIYEGDVVREVSDVNLRMPIDSAVWKLTVGLIKMAPRPLKFVVARELSVDVDDVDFAPMEYPGNLGDAMGQLQQTPCNNNTNDNSATPMVDSKFGPTREIVFLEPCLGVKLHHTTHGYVQILSVTPYKSFPNSPLARTGDIQAGDVVLEVGGVWNLREPIDSAKWGVLIKFIRETRRPLCMIVAEGDRLNSVMTIEEEEESQEEQPNDGEVKPADSSDGNEKSEDSSPDSKLHRESPEICNELSIQLSIDALQEELIRTHI